VADRRRLLADFTPLRVSPAYRRMMLGSAASSIGSMMTIFAVSLQVFRVTHSSAAVGGIGLAVAIPALLLGPFGGALSDSFERRRLVLVTTTALAATSLALFAQAWAGNRRVWLLYLIAGMQATLGTISGPARRTFMPRLLPRDLIPAGAALSMMAMHTAMLCGPLLAGLIVPVGGLKACYAVDALTFLAAFYGVFRLPTMRPEGGPSGRPTLAGVAEGVRFVLSSKVLTGVLLADISATLFAMPVALYPAINAERFGGSPRTLGLLGAGLAVGGIVGSVFSGPLGRVRRPGLGVLAAGAAWGAALAGFGAVHSLAPTLAFLVLAGIADVTSVVLRTTIIQLATPDHYRGRVNSLEIMVGANVPQVGNFRAGMVAEATSPGFSAALGGILAAVGAAVIGLALPAIVRYRTEEQVSEAQPARR
jgi:MFS family permease